MNANDLTKGGNFQWIITDGRENNEDAACLATLRRFAASGSYGEVLQVTEEVAEEQVQQLTSHLDKRKATRDFILHGSLTRPLEDFFDSEELWAATGSVVANANNRGIPARQAMLAMFKGVAMFEGDVVTAIDRYLDIDPTKQAEMMRHLCKPLGWNVFLRTFIELGVPRLENWYDTINLVRALLTQLFSERGRRLAGPALWHTAEAALNQALDPASAAVNEQTFSAALAGLIKLGQTSAKVAWQMTCSATLSTFLLHGREQHWGKDAAWRVLGQVILTDLNKCLLAESVRGRGTATLDRIWPVPPFHLGDFIGKVQAIADVGEVNEDVQTRLVNVLIPAEQPLPFSGLWRFDMGYDDRQPPAQNPPDLITTNDEAALVTALARTVVAHPNAGLFIHASKMLWHNLAVITCCSKGVDSEHRLQLWFTLLQVYCQPHPDLKRDDCARLDWQSIRLLLQQNGLNMAELLAADDGNKRLRTDLATMLFGDCGLWLIRCMRKYHNFHPGKDLEPKISLIVSFVTTLFPHHPKTADTQTLSVQLVLLTLQPLTLTENSVAKKLRTAALKLCTSETLAAFITKWRAKLTKVVESGEFYTLTEEKQGVYRKKEALLDIVVQHKPAGSTHKMQTKLLGSIFPSAHQVSSRNNAVQPALGKRDAPSSSSSSSSTSSSSTSSTVKKSRKD